MPAIRRKHCTVHDGFFQNPVAFDLTCQLLPSARAISCLFIDTLAGGVGGQSGI